MLGARSLSDRALMSWSVSLACFVAVPPLSFPPGFCSGQMYMAFEPIDSIVFCTALEMPVPTATRRMTEAVPIRIPSMVSSERIRFAKSPLRATCKLSNVMRRLPAPASEARPPWQMMVPRGPPSCDGSSQLVSAGGGPGDVEPPGAGRAVEATAHPAVGGAEQPVDHFLLAVPLGEQQRRSAGHVRGGHRGAGQCGVLVQSVLLPDTRQDVARRQAAADATGGHQAPLGVAEGAGVRSDLVGRARGADHDGIERAVVGASEQAEAGGVLVAGGQDRDGAMGPGVLDAFGQDGAGQRGEEVVGVTEAQVDDAGTVVDDPADPVVDVLDRAVAGGAENLGHHELGARGDTGDPHAVAGRAGGDAGHVGAVALLVLAGAGAAGGVSGGAD